MAYRNTFFRWLFLYSLTFGLTYVLKLFTYLCPETGQCGEGWTHWREVYRCFLMPLSVPCFRKDKIEKSAGTSDMQPQI